MTTPRVTVLMAVHDDERFVGAAVRSILDQTFTDFEFVIVNDASTDGSREIVGAHADPRIRLVDNPKNLGLTRSLNRGLALARGQYVARFDANDLSRRDRLIRQVAFLDAYPDVLAVGSRARLIRRNGRVVRRSRIVPALTREGIDWALMFYAALLHPASMFRRSAVERLGGYDERFVSAQDMDLWSRLAAVGRLANLPQPLVDLRVDPGSISGFRSTPRRLRMLGHMTRVLRDNVRRLTGEEPPADGALESWIRTINSDPELTAAEIGRALALIRATRRRFAAVRPESRRNREIADQVAFFHEHAAFALCRVDRRAALRVFVRAVASSPLHAARDLPRFAARLCLGEMPVRLWRELAHR